ncbi:MAG: phosphatase PAP2 family protein, partial [Pseudonocardiaceae bacterium]
ALFPLTPPRLAPELSFVDTMHAVGPSAYPPGDDGIANQYAAMPSLHVGWALLVAIVVTRLATSRFRLLVWIHPAATLFVVVVTANPYWMDGLVASAILLGVIGCVSSRVWKPVEKLEPSMATGGH